jgi:hypothetical protein
MAHNAAILRWTGRGKIGDLRSTVEFILRDRKVIGRVVRVGNSLAVFGVEPTSLCSIFEHLPGVAWAAAGHGVSTIRGAVEASIDLAPKYLKRGDRFRVEAEVTQNGFPSDLAGAVTSGILESVKGSRVSSEAPKVVFMAALDRQKGVVGVEVLRGPGGVPTGSERVTCLASGGRHSSVLAWSALLMGFRVNLVHARSDYESVLAVARLYSELSHRGDPRGLKLEVLGAVNPAHALMRAASRSKDPVYGGFTATTGGVPATLGGVQAPLYFMPEERFDSEFSSLKLREYDSRTEWDRQGTGKVYCRTFGGRTADVSDVIDGLG